MFEYFPGNYVWSTAVNIALGNGGQMGEIDQACRPAREAAAFGDDEKVRILVDSWIRGCGSRQRAGRDRASQGRLISAGAKFRRASVYYASAERMYGARSPKHELRFTRRSSAAFAASWSARAPASGWSFPSQARVFQRSM